MLTSLLVPLLQVTLWAGVYVLSIRALLAASSAVSSPTALKSVAPLLPRWVVVAALISPMFEYLLLTKVGLGPLFYIPSEKCVLTQRSLLSSRLLQASGVPLLEVRLFSSNLLQVHEKLIHSDLVLPYRKLRRRSMETTLLGRSTRRESSVFPTSLSPSLSHPSHVNEADQLLLSLLFPFAARSPSSSLGLESTSSSTVASLRRVRFCAPASLGFNACKTTVASLGNLKETESTGQAPRARGGLDVHRSQEEKTKRRENKRALIPSFFPPLFCSRRTAHTIA